MGVIDNLGYISEAAHFPCSAPAPTLVIKAAARAAFPVLMQAATFGCMDIMKMRAGVSPWHARGLKALIKGAIPADQAGLASKILKFTLPVEKGLFFYFVVDLTVEFFANWQSQMFILNACDTQQDGCSYSGTFPSWLSIPLGRWNPVAYFDTHGVGNCPYTLRGDLHVPPGAFYSLFFDFKTIPLNPRFPTANVQTRLRQVFPSNFAFAPQDNTPPWTANPLTASYLAKGRNQRGITATYVMEAMSEQECVAFTGSVHASISNLPIHDDSIIPVNCFGKPVPGTGPVLTG